MCVCVRYWRGEGDRDGRTKRVVIAGHKFSFIVVTLVNPSGYAMHNVDAPLSIQGVARALGAHGDPLGPS